MFSRQVASSGLIFSSAAALLVFGWPAFASSAETSTVVDAAFSPATSSVVNRGTRFLCAGGCWAKATMEMAPNRATQERARNEIFIRTPIWGETAGGRFRKQD